MVGLVSGCADAEEEYQDNEIEQMDPGAVVDQTTNDYFYVDPELGAHLVVEHTEGLSFPKVQFWIRSDHPNRFELWLEADLYTDGSTPAVTCKEEDLRRNPSLQEEFMAIQIPCPSIPEGVTRVVIRGE